MYCPKEYVVASVASNLHPIQSEIITDLTSKGYNENDIFAIRLAMDEAFVNALKHGNNNEPKKHVKIYYTANKKQMKMSIEDEGEGFDYNSLADPTSEENLGQIHGRGIFLIKQFTSFVEFNKVGNKITFIYEKDGPFGAVPEGAHVWHHNHITIVSLYDDICNLSASKLEEYLVSLVQKGHDKIIIDLNNLKHINSSILGAFIRTAKILKKEKGRIKLIRPCPGVDHVLEVTKMYDVLDISSDLGKAIDELGNN